MEHDTLEYDSSGLLNTHKARNNIAEVVSFNYSFGIT